MPALGVRERCRNAFSSALEKQVFNAKIQGQALSMTLAGALNCKYWEKWSKQIVCECLNIKQCLDQGVNHVSKTGSHLVFLQLQTVPTAAIGVCRGVNARAMAENQPRLQGFGWHGDKHTEKLAPSHPQSCEWVERQQEILPDSYAGRLWGSGRGRGDVGGSGRNTSRGALWADTKDWLGKLCPAFGNHTEAKEMEPPEECKMNRSVVLFERC